MEIVLKIKLEDLVENLNHVQIDTADFNDGFIELKSGNDVVRVPSAQLDGLIYSLYAKRRVLRAIYPERFGTWFDTIDFNAIRDRGRGGDDE